VYSVALLSKTFKVIYLKLTYKIIAIFSVDHCDIMFQNVLLWKKEKGSDEFTETIISRQIKADDKKLFAERYKRISPSARFSKCSKFFKVTPLVKRRSLVPYVNLTKLKCPL